MNSTHIPEEFFKERAMDQGDPGDENDHRPTMAAERGSIRQFETGATRNRDDEQLDYHGFMSPLVRKRYAEYMHANRRQADGTLRDSDNWQKGIPVESYCSSLVRHVTDAELHQDDFPEAAREDLETALCAVIFNAQGWLYEILEAKYEAGA